MVVTKDKKSTKPLEPAKLPSPERATTPKRRLGKPLIWVAGIVAVTSLGVGVTRYLVSQVQNQSSTPAPAVSVAPAKIVTALGRLEPQGEVIKLSVTNAQDSRVDKLLVEEGDRVASGQVIAILQGLDKKQAELAEAEQNLAVWQAKLVQVKAGESKTGEITAQKANIGRIEAQASTETAARKAAVARAAAELRNAQINYQRYQRLQQQGAESISALDDRREAFETAQAQLREAQAQLENTVSTLQKQLQQEQAMLDKLIEVRPTDVRVAQAEVKRAIAQVSRIKAELEDFYVRVPVAGQILKINTRVGEQVNTTEGIVELGRTNQMYAVAEVYETDVGKVQVGQRASIVSEHGGFAGEVHGTVDHVGLQIKKQDVFDSDPAADKDARVVEVKVVHMEDGRLAKATALRT